MRFLALFLSFFLCTIALSSDLVEKAQSIEEILAGVGRAQIISSFESTSMIGGSVGTMRKMGVDKKVEKTYGDQVVKFVHEEAGPAAISTFTLAELAVLEKLAAESEEGKSLAVKIVFLASANDPKMMQISSSIMMDYSKAMMESQKRKRERK